MVKPYIFLFNIGSAGGWAYLLFLTVQSLSENLSPEEYFSKVAEVLIIVQSLAIMEILHAGVGLVRSGVVTTTMQVLSRLLQVWFVCRISPGAQADWSIYLMVMSWSLVEVPRYMFYAFNLYMKNVPTPLFYLRYSLFYILYPFGITGEYIQIYRSLPDFLASSVPFWYFLVVIMFLYIPAGPYMYFHMMKQRKSAIRRRMMSKRKPRPIEGVEYPMDKKGRRGTTTINKTAWETSIRSVDTGLADAVKRERNWRFGYSKHVVANTEFSAKSTKTCLRVARAGLEYLHNTFEVNK